MKTYRIIDDSGVDYAFLGEDREKRPWKGCIVRGGPNPSLYPDAISVEKPYGLTGTYTASAECFEEIVQPLSIKGAPLTLRDEEGNVRNFVLEGATLALLSGRLVEVEGNPFMATVARALAGYYEG